MYKRLKPKTRAGQVAEAAYAAANGYGFENFTRSQVARQANCSTGTVSSYFTSRELHVEVLRLARERRNYSLLRHVLAGPYRAAIPLPKAIRQNLLNSLK